MPEEEEQLSAQVILATSPAADLDPGVAEEIRSWFEDHGFETGAVFAGSFSITAPARRFIAAFELEAGVLDEAARWGGELPLDGLPVRTRDPLSAIAFSAPPDFGPGAP